MADNKTKSKLASRTGSLFPQPGSSSGMNDSKASMFLQPEEGDKVLDIPIDMIDDFPDHPFQVKDDASMESLRTDIKKHGMHTPVLVLKNPDHVGRYIMIAGHRRRYACKTLGFKEIKAIVKDVSLDDATRIMVTSNLEIRDKILPSEKAHAYKLLRDVEEKNSSSGKTADQIGLETGESGDTINRYIRLTYLIEPLINAVDNGLFGYAAGADISFLSETEQTSLSHFIQNKYRLDGKKAALLKAYSKDGKLTEALIEKVMLGAMADEKIAVFSLKSDRIKTLLPKNIKKKQIEDYILVSIQQRQLIESILGDRSTDEIEAILKKALSSYK